MAEKKKINRISLAISGSTFDTATLTQGNKRVERNYNEQEVFEQKVIASKEISEQKELERLMKQSTEEDALDRNVKLMSPTRMVLRRFFRSKLSIVGLVMVIGLFLFSFLGPVFYTEWGETELDESGSVNIQKQLLR